MGTLYISASARILGRFMRIALPFWTSNQKWKALRLLAGMLLLLVGVALTNVYINSVVGKYTEALKDGHEGAFWTLLWQYIQALLFATPITVYYQFLRTKLAIVWRQWLTQHLLGRYLAHRTYFHMARDSSIDNPDERMSNDVETFVNMTVGFTITILDALITIATFTYVLASISQSLTATVWAYAVVGSILTVWGGQKLVGLNFEHVKLEADLRYSLAEMRRDVESIAFYRGERRAKLYVFKALVRAVKNQEALMILNRNLGFFTISYNFMAAVIPVAIAAPIYFAGHMHFGDMTRATMAFGNIFAAMTLLVVQINAVSAYAANIDRVGSFIEALDAKGLTLPQPRSVIEVQVGETLELDNVTVLTPDSSRVLAEKVSFALDQGERLLIMGPSGAGKSTMLRAIAGLATAGCGRIIRPDASKLMFLPQRAYAPTCTLREAVCYPHSSGWALDTQLLSTLRLVNLSELAMRAGGLDKEQNWRDMLSNGEQQRLSFARLLLAVSGGKRGREAGATTVFLDEATSALDPKNENLLYSVLGSLGVCVVSVGHRRALIEHHDKLFILDGKGGGKLLLAKDYQSGEDT